MAYTKKTWKDFPNASTPITAEDLQNIEDGIEDVDNRLSGIIESGSGIIESGSNANGNYIKYADGTMICYNKYKRANFENTLSGGTSSYYYKANNGVSGRNEMQFTFPQAFIDFPTVTANVASNAYTMASIGTVTKTTVELFVVTSYAVSSLRITWNYIAIGKWK